MLKLRYLGFGVQVNVLEQVKSDIEVRTQKPIT